MMTGWCGIVSKAQAELDEILEGIYHSANTDGAGSVWRPQFVIENFREYILDWRNKQIEAVLDRLVRAGVPNPTTPAGDNEFVPMSEISVILNEHTERKKLKAGDDA